MSVLVIALSLLLLAGVFQGTFGIGMKKFEPHWEAYWFVFSFIGMLCLPLLWSSVVIPNVFGAIFTLPLTSVLFIVFLGAVWGATGMMFGISINLLGVSLAYGIAMGLGAAVGAVFPLLKIPNALSNPAVPFIILGILLLLVGVFINTIAGRRREEIQDQVQKEKANIKSGKGFILGINLAIVSGIGAAIINVGFTLAQPAIDAAHKQGAAPHNASLVAWVMFFFGGFIASLVYCIFLFIKNKTFGVLTKRKTFVRIAIWAPVTALMWFGALAFYGQGAAVMGPMGNVVGWIMLYSLALVISNIWGIMGGEWKGAANPFKILIIGNIILIISWIIMGYANSRL